MSSLPYISFVILAYNNWDLTQQCLTSLAASMDSLGAEHGVEIIVVDNGSSESNRHNLRHFHAVWRHSFIKMQIVMLEENMGYPSGINAGLGRCQGEIIGVLNNNLVFPPGWLEPLIQAVQADKLVGFATPHLSFSETVQSVEKKFSSFDEMKDFAAEFSRTNSEKFLYVDKVAGACVLMRRDVLMSIGGRDFWLGTGHYDDDWCLRLRLSGYKIVLVGASFVEQVVLEATEANSEQLKENSNPSAMKFEVKWDLFETENPDGAYSRTGVLRTTQFNRSRHYVPVAKGQFSTASKPFYPRSSSQRRFLLCADWTSPQSEWRETLSSLLRKHHHIEVCLWIPKTYFHVQEVIKQIQNHVASESIDVALRYITLTLFNEEVPFVDTLRVLRSVDEVVPVRGDFVNRYIVYLARDMGLTDVTLSNVLTPFKTI